MGRVAISAAERLPSVRAPMLEPEKAFKNGNTLGLYDRRSSIILNVDDRLYPREKGRDNSKIWEDLSNIQEVSKQPLDVSTVIRMARCEISSLKIN